MKKGIEQLFVERMIEEKISSASLWAGFKKDRDGLVAVITQDFETLKVLMLAFMDEEAFIRTIETGFMHYHSRSRGQLWLKGETSGHYQRVIDAKIDCDKDALLFMIDQTGVACHTGERSCFYRTLEMVK